MAKSDLPEKPERPERPERPDKPDSPVTPAGGDFVHVKHAANAGVFLNKSTVIAIEHEEIPNPDTTPGQPPTVTVIKITLPNGKVIQFNIPTPVVPEDGGEGEGETLAKYGL